MADAPAEVLVSKGEFARLINVSPGRVSQMIAEGKIGKDALEGEGRSARIRANLARRQISDRTDVGQRFGNGIETQLDLPSLTPSNAAGATRAPAGDPTTDAIKLERLRGLRMANERAAEDHLAEQGRYVRADHSQAAMTKMAAALLTIFEGSLADLASALAAQHKLVQRDVLHQLRTEFRSVRVKAAESVRRTQASLPQLVADEVADATDPAQGEA
jgi:hypothetical protein